MADPPVTEYTEGNGQVSFGDVDTDRLAIAAILKTTEPIAVLDPSGRMRLANPAMLRRLGASLEDLVGKAPDDVAASGELSTLRKTAVSVAQTGKSAVIRIDAAANGATAESHVMRFVPETASDGRVEHVIVFGSALPATQSDEAGVTQAQDQLHAAVKVLPDIFWIKNADGRYVLCNDQFEKFNKIKKGSAIGGRASDLADGEALEIHQKTDAQALTTKEPVRFEMEVPSQDGDGSRHYDIQKVAIHDARGAVTGILGLARDITDNRRLEHELRTREREYRQLAEHLPDCLIRMDANGSAILLNEALKVFLRDDLGATPGHQFEDTNLAPRSLASLSELRNDALMVLRQGEPLQKEYVFQHLDGRHLVHEIRLFPEFETDGAAVSVLGIGRDVTDRKNTDRKLLEKERELQRLAFTDSLTGLANRATFSDHFQAEIRTALSTGRKVALLTLDVDRFKSINDSLGHAIGDELLRRFARRLVEAVGKDVWIGRLGGDEFAIIAPELSSPDEAEILARQIIEFVGQPICLDEISLSVSTCIGIAVAPDDGKCEAALLRYSDIALYRAKADGGGQFRRYTPEMSRRAEERFAMEATINEGLRLGQFMAYVQPKVDLATQKISGAEALCRWRHPEKGFISPAEFIPIAEDTGQILEIGRLVLYQAAAFARLCNHGRADPFVVAVNVSARQLLYGGFLDTLRLCLEHTGCRAEWLELEITESLLLNDDSTVFETLQTIADLGILISIDDFGTGYSALSYLHQFPIGGLKIDQSFIRRIDHDEKQEVLVRAILAMASGLGLKTVAEGVECESTAALLARLGCDQGQGYFWGKPMPTEELLKLARDDRRARASA